MMNEREANSILERHCLRRKCGHNALIFCRMWQRLEMSGRVDGFGGAEFFRVFGEWAKKGCPEPTEEFLYSRANIDAESNEPPAEELIP